MLAIQAHAHPQGRPQAHPQAHPLTHTLNLSITHSIAQPRGACADGIRQHGADALDNRERFLREMSEQVPPLARVWVVRPKHPTSVYLVEVGSGTLYGDFEELLQLGCVCAKEQRPHARKVRVAAHKVEGAAREHHR
jgi:hypothetical protein